MSDQPARPAGVGIDGPFSRDTTTTVWPSFERFLRRTQANTHDSIASVVFLGFDFPRDAQQFRQLVRGWATGQGLAWRDAAPDEVSRWRPEDFPGPGVTWLGLAGADARSWWPALHRLNELRAAWHTHSANCLIVAGPAGDPDLLTEAAQQAGDLWAVQSLARRVVPTFRPPAATDERTKALDWPSIDLPDDRAESALTPLPLEIPEHQDSPTMRELLRWLQQAERTLSADHTSAWDALRSAQALPTEPTGPTGRTLISLTSAKIHLAAGHRVPATADLIDALVGAQALSPPLRTAVLSRIGAEALRADAGEVARLAGEQLVADERALAERDFSWLPALANDEDWLGDRWRQHGDLARARAHYQAAFTIRADLARQAQELRETRAKLRALAQALPPTPSHDQLDQTRSRLRTLAQALPPTPSQEQLAETRSKLGTPAQALTSDSGPPNPSDEPASPPD